MSSRVEIIGRISCDALEEVKDILLADSIEKDWLFETDVAISSYFDLAIASGGSTILVLTPKFIQRKDERGSQNMTHFFPSEKIECSRGKITAVAILPVISTKRSDCGQPETTVICVGTESGYVLFYMPSGLMLIEQLFHVGKIENVNFRCFSRNQPMSALTIIYQDCIVEVDGCDLHQTLRVARVSPEIARTPLKIKKRLLTPGNNSVASVGMFSLTRFDQYFNASFWGENETVSSRVPRYNSFVCGSDKFLSYYHHIDALDQSAISSAITVGKGLLKKTTGWFWGSGSQNQEDKQVPIEPGVSMEIRAKIQDKNRRVLEISHAPYGIPIAAVADSLGRVHIADTNQMTILRIIKGQRDAQIAWLTSSNESKSALFLVILDRLGTCSVISSVFGPRVALWNFGKGSILLTETSQIGVNVQNIKAVAPSHYQVAVLNPDGEIKRLYVPLHLALNDQNSPRLSDLATFKVLSQELRSPQPDLEEIHKLLERLRLTTTQRQALEKIISSEKFGAEIVLKFVSLFEEKLADENLSGTSESKDFKFWIAKLKNVIRIFEIFGDPVSVRPDLVDINALLTDKQCAEVKTLFKLTSDLDCLQNSKVKFANTPKSKSLYEFSRCFIEASGSFKLHQSISPTRKQSLAVNFFTSIHLEDLCNELLLSMEDYFDLLVTYIQFTEGSLDLVSDFYRLVTLTEKIYSVQLDLNWKIYLRETLKTGNPVNGLLFTAVLIFSLPKTSDETKNEWTELVANNEWYEALEHHILAASLQPLCLNLGDQVSKIESVSANLLKSYGIGAVTELVSDWYVSWFLTDQSEPHSNPRVALIQEYIQNHLVKTFPLSLNRDLLSTSIFWSATSAWASCNKQSTSDKLIIIVIDVLRRLNQPHLASGISLFAWKALIGKKFETLTHEISDKRKITLGTKTTQTGHRKDSPAKNEQTMALIGGLLDILLGADTDETPPPDIATELTEICHGHNRKPSICEIALNQPIANPALLGLHQQLLTYLNLKSVLALKSTASDIFSPDEENQFFKPLDRMYGNGISDPSTFANRFSFIQDVIASIISQRRKKKLDENALVKYYHEVRRLCAEWEFDCETEVDIPFVATCMRNTIDIPSFIHIQDVERMSNELCKLLANSTRKLLSMLNGEDAAGFLTDLAPFNINGWLNNDGNVAILSPNRDALLKLIDYIQSLEGRDETMRENLSSMKRALGNL